jgi:hypothetical protein
MAARAWHELRPAHHQLRAPGPAAERPGHAATFSRSTTVDRALLGYFVGRSIMSRIETYCVTVRHAGVPPSFHEFQAKSEIEAVQIARSAYPTAAAFSASKGACQVGGSSIPRQFGTSSFDPDGAGAWHRAVIPARAALQLGVWIPPNVVIMSVTATMAQTDNGGDPTETERRADGWCGTFGTAHDFALLATGHHPTDPSLRVQTAIFRSYVSHAAGCYIKVRWA